jgi:hypothetical protein
MNHHKLILKMIWTHVSSFRTGVSNICHSKTKDDKNGDGDMGANNLLLQIHFLGKRARKGGERERMNE